MCLRKTSCSSVIGSAVVIIGEILALCERGRKSSAGIGDFLHLLYDANDLPTYMKMSLVIEENEIDSLPITIDPEILGGTPVFRGTRVPVDALLSNLEAGVSIDEFLENFPSVSREQVVQVLEFSRTTLHRLTKMK